MKPIPEEREPDTGTGDDPHTLTLTRQDIEQMFLDWLRDRPVPLNLNHFQQSIAESEAALPEADCAVNGFPEGTTFGHAVRCSVAFFDQNGVEYRLDTRIRFTSEADSLRWWRNNRDNPDRVRLARQSDGTWALSVAPIGGPDRADWKSGF